MGFRTSVVIAFFAAVLAALDVGPTLLGSVRWE
jgi:hypothetical protein